MPLSNKPLFGEASITFKYSTELWEAVSYRQLTLLPLLIYMKPSYLVSPDKILFKKKTDSNGWFLETSLPPIALKMLAL